MKYPISTVVAVLVKDKKVLLVKRGHVPFRGFWALPGGHIDAYEKAEKAVAREVKEETGLRFSPSFFGWYDEVFPKLKWHAVVHVFTGAFSGGLKCREREILDIGWFSKAEVRKMKLAFVHRKVLEDFWSGQ